MRYRTLEKRVLNFQSYNHRKAEEEDCSELVDEDTVITLKGQEEPALVYLKNVDSKGLLDACDSINIPTSTRTSGLVTTSRIFGYSPRNMIRNAPCKATSLAEESPKEHEEIINCAEIAAFYYRRYAPVQADKHQYMTDNYVLPEYRLGTSMFTSGIVNENNPLMYHFDSGNYPKVWSAMFAFKKDIDGGHLCVPEIDLKFKTGDGSLILFDGQGLMHGVTSIKKLSNKAKRYTIVYYSLKNMWSCEPYEDEIENMRNSRTITEINKK